MSEPYWRPPQTTRSLITDAAVVIAQSFFFLGMVAFLLFVVYVVVTP